MLRAGAGAQRRACCGWRVQAMAQKVDAARGFNQ